MRKSKGFTLIELLIVIAIIGILAAVLIPQLMGARNAAVQRAGQAHSANVYTALVAALAVAPTGSTPASIVATSGTNCMVVPAGALPGDFGWRAAPGGVTTCTIAAVGLSDFTATVAMDPGVGGGPFVNGRAP